ncbi:MAG: class A beta-lactamase, subclass A2 [Bacteroidales bacterium]|jgi:beta-lactamase class A|nr:class A beta-lactamase, subclass A2 [Bacteroidales bacterium]
MMSLPKTKQKTAAATATILFLLITFPVFAQTTILKSGIEEIIAGKKAEIGVAICEIKSKDTLNINGDARLPMASVFKFHIALAVLSKVDSGQFNLNQEIYVKKTDLLPDTWSPMREKYPNGEVKLKLSEILKYTVSESDNNGCDILLRLIGSTKTVNDYMHKIGIKAVSIQANEEEMHKDWNIQFSNWTTPKAATKLLTDFYDGKLLSKESYDFLWTIMSETTGGKNRIKGQLPEETWVAHKTGTSDTNEFGITAAINDIGIVTLPDGRHLAISIFISNSKESHEVNEKIISDISKMAWDYFVRTIK